MTTSIRSAAAVLGPLLGGTLLATGIVVGVPLARSQDDGLVVEGLRGTIPAAAVSQVVTARMDDLVRCVTSRASSNDVLSGSVTIGFVIAVDGTTRVARIASSDVGDVDAERCMTRIGSGLRFRRPTGGEADVTEQVRVPLDPEVRPPVVWTADRVSRTAGPSIARLATRCRVSGGRVRVTAYVGPGGNVMSVGGFASVPALDSTVSCVAEGVRRLPMPSPGSYPAKVSFDVGI